jgi:predicted HTH transcriptional regulator
MRKGSLKLAPYKYPTKQELLNLISNQEDNFIERKLESVKDKDIRKTIVAFANSVPEPKIAVLFIGVSNDGLIQGVTNPDNFQKRIRDICENDCYPPIDFKTEVLEKDNKSIVAVIIPPSKDRPHFSGLPYIRKGSESVKAPRELFEEMIASRNSKTYEILKWKDKLVTVINENTLETSSSYYAYAHKVEGCTAHSVQLFNINSHKHISIPLEDIKLCKDRKRRDRLKIIKKSQ